jgi:hypothetical protein
MHSFVFHSAKKKGQNKNFISKKKTISIFTIRCSSASSLCRSRTNSRSVFRNSRVWAFACSLKHQTKNKTLNKNKIFIPGIDDFFPNITYLKSKREMN